jgi:hypothetical protein
MILCCSWMIAAQLRADNSVTGDSLVANQPNNPPQISSIPNQSIAAGQTLGPISFTVTDDKTSPANLQVARNSSNTAVVPNNRITLGGTGPNRTITIMPPANANGTTTITVTASDGEATSQTSFDVVVSGASQSATRDFGDAPRNRPVREPR